MKIILALCALLFSTAFSQHNHQTSTDGIKSLSQDELKGYSEGLGMGQAKAAELNGYPGPKHLLERKEELNLTETQVQQFEKLRDEMFAEAKKFGAEVIEAEKALNDLFASGEVNEELLRAAVRKAGEAKANVRYAHLKTHIAAKKILSADQLKKYYTK